MIGASLASMLCFLEHLILGSVALDAHLSDELHAWRA